MSHGPLRLPDQDATLRKRCCRETVFVVEQTDGPGLRPLGGAVGAGTAGCQPAPHKTACETQSTPVSGCGKSMRNWAVNLRPIVDRRGGRKGGLTARRRLTTCPTSPDRIHFYVALDRPGGEAAEFQAMVRVCPLSGTMRTWNRPRTGGLRALADGAGRRSGSQCSSLPCRWRASCFWADGDSMARRNSRACVWSPQGTYIMPGERADPRFPIPPRFWAKPSGWRLWARPARGSRYWTKRSG